MPADCKGSLITTPSQTVGPYLSLVLPWADGPDAVAPGTPCTLTIAGQLTDGEGSPVPDGLVESWQADPDGRFNHSSDPRGPSEFPGFRGFARCPTSADGEFVVHTLKPGSLPDGSGGLEAPHLNVSVFARGLLTRLVTRIYFPDEAATNANDPVLLSLPASERARLTAIALPDAHLRFDIRLQGTDQTPFFQL